MDLPSLFCIHLRIGNPPILKTEIHPCRRPLTSGFKIGIYKYICLYKLVVKQIIEKVSLKLVCKDKCNIFGISNLVLKTLTVLFTDLGSLISELFCASLNRYQLKMDYMHNFAQILILLGYFCLDL